MRLRVGLTNSRILVVMPDHWTRALLRAELIERGYDTVGATSLAHALTYPTVDEVRGPVRLIVVDQLAMMGAWEKLVENLAAKHDHPPMVLLASTQSERPSGDWSAVIERPASIDDIALRIESTLDRTRAESLSPPSSDVSPAADTVPRKAFETRMGPPWPKIACPRCRTSRHYEPPRDVAEMAAIEADMSKFAREHRACARSGR